MSAFLCDDITINRIVSFLLDDAWGKDEFNAPLREIGINLRSDTLGTAMAVSRPEGSCRQLACAMRMLNLYALKCRYGGRPYSRPPAFDFHLVDPISPEDFAYTLGCFTYQCAEGDALEKPLGAALQTIAEASFKMYFRALWEREHPRPVTTPEGWRLSYRVGRYRS